MPDNARRTAARLQFEPAREPEAFFADRYSDDTRRRQERERIHYQEATDGHEA